MENEEEGQLKKRILQLNENGMWSKEDYSLSVNDVFEILDEAAKEFPDENNEKYKDRSGLSLSITAGQGYHFDYALFIEDLHIWLKKWFSDSKTGKLSSATASQRS